MKLNYIGVITSLYALALLSTVSLSESSGWHVLREDAVRIEAPREIPVNLIAGVSNIKCGV